LAGNVWHGNGAVGFGKVDWPGEGQPNLDPNHVDELFLERGRRNFRAKPEEVLPVAVRFAADGTLVEPQPFRTVPRPSDWSRNLAGGAAAAWDNLKAAELDRAHPERLSVAVQALGAATDEPGSNRQAEFLLLQSSPADESATVAKLIGLGRRAVRDRLETEHGLPLGVVALAEAARRSPEARLEREWFWLLGELTFQQPSSLTPWVLDLGDELARRTDDPKEADLIGKLRARWISTERLRELAGRLTELVRPSPTLHENRWLTNRGTGWLAVIQPGFSFLNTSTNGRPLTLTNRESRARLFSTDTLALAAFNGLHTVAWVNGRERLTPPRLPPGMSLSLELEGHLLNVPAARPVQDVPAPVLAEAAGEFRADGIMGETGERFDVWPSRPKFTVRVHLADSAALFVAQRRQQWLFGGMILVTAGVAGLGAWQMNRAFRRQLALNAEKSNFVASVSHELRTPLASLRLLAEGLAAGRVEEESKRREYAGFLVQETRRLGALVKSTPISFMARARAGRADRQGY
jgi:signal transduction histidine kinase